MSRRLYETNVRAASGTDHGRAPCLLCASRATNAVFEIDGLDGVVRRCTDCGVGWMDPLPDPETISAFYPQDYYGDGGRKFSRLIEPVVRFVARRHNRFLVKPLRRRARVLDVGCGRGVLLSNLASRGFEAHGTEISEVALAGIDPRIHTQVCSSLIEAAYPDHFFDQIVLWHVLEHLRNPVETLREAFRITAPGGRIVVAVPNFSSWQARWSGTAWFHLDPPRHLFHFSMQALSNIVMSAGFSIESTHHFSLRQNPFGWVQSALNKIPSLRRNLLYESLHRLAPGGPRAGGVARAAMLACFALGMPIALALEIPATLFRSGATIHVVGVKPTGAGSDQPESP